jgi:hypothetical protein
MPELAAWNSFYEIVGTSAGALIGLQFVVMTLIAQTPSRTAADGAAAYATPTIVHFSVVLLLAALVVAPWHSFVPVALLCRVVGILGLAYTLIVARRMWRTGGYQPEIEDWLFHLIVPLAAYAALTTSAWVAMAHLHEATFGIAAGALLLIFTGIHNTWDALTYHVLVRIPRKRKMPEDED